MQYDIFTAIIHRHASWVYSWCSDRFTIRVPRLIAGCHSGSPHLVYHTDDRYDYRPIKLHAWAARHPIQSILVKQQCGVTVIRGAIADTERVALKLATMIARQTSALETTVCLRTRININTESRRHYNYGPSCTCFGCLKIPDKN